MKLYQTVGRESIEGWDGSNLSELCIKRFLTRHETTITQPQNLTDVTHRPLYSHRKWLIVRRCIYLSTRGEALDADCTMHCFTIVAQCTCKHLSAIPIVPGPCIGLVW